MIYDIESKEFIDKLVDCDSLRQWIEKKPNLAIKLYGSNYFSNYDQVSYD